MKRLLALVLAVVMVCTFALTGCGSKEEGLKVGFIYIGTAGDAGYSFAHDLGRKYVEEKLGDKGVVTVKVEGVPETADVEKAMKNLIDQGCKAIFANSYGYMEFVAKVAEEYPDVKFFHCSGYMSNDKNFVNYFGKIEEARYLTGIVAGLKTKTNKIGYAAAMPIPEVIRGINSFTLGVRSVNPDAVVNVKWTNTWNDAQLEKQAATALLDEGNDVIAQHQDTTAPLIAAQEKGAFAIGYNSDSASAAPKAYLTAAVWNWGVYYADQIEKIMAGTWEAKNYYGNMKDGLVDIAPLTDNVAPGTKEKVEEVKAKIIDGSFDIWSGPIKDQKGEVKIAEGSVMTEKEQAELQWFVEGVNGSIK